MQTVMSMQRLFRSDAEIADAVANYTVFGRVTPDQKRKFVHALKDQGKTVAMTGDGVNDVLALKDADCSVAMASGSDAAVQASQVVLLESNFACMPSVVMEGRRVVNNIQRSASLFLVKQYLLLPVVLILRSADDYLSDGTIPDIADQHVYDRSTWILPGVPAK